MITVARSMTRSNDRMLAAGMANFWSELARPIIGLAPMDGITDHPFRSMTCKYGKPAVTYTEFTSVERICRGRQHRELRGFVYDETQRPIVAQVYGRTPEYFRQTAVLLANSALTASTSTWVARQRVSRRAVPALR